MIDHKVFAARLADRNATTLTVGNQPQSIAEDIWARAQSDDSLAVDRAMGLAVVEDHGSVPCAVVFGFRDGSRILFGEQITVLNESPRLASGARYLQ